MFFSDDHKYPETIINGMLKILNYILHIPILTVNRLFSQDKQYAPFSFSVHKSFNKLLVLSFSSSQGPLN